MSTKTLNPWLIKGELYPLECHKREYVGHILAKTYLNTFYPDKYAEVKEKGNRDSPDYGYRFYFVTKIQGDKLERYELCMIKIDNTRVLTIEELLERKDCTTFITVEGSTLSSESHPLISPFDTKCLLHLYSKEDTTSLYSFMEIIRKMGEHTQETETECPHMSRKKKKGKGKRKK